MTAKILSILLKRKEDRNLRELVELIGFWSTTSLRELKYGLNLTYHFEKMYGTSL